MATAYQVIKGIVVTVVSLAVWYFISTHLKFEIDIVTELPDKSLSMSGLRLPKSPFAQVAVCPRSPFAQLGQTETWANGDQIENIIIIQFKEINSRFQKAQRIREEVIN